MAKKNNPGKNIVLYNLMALDQIFKETNVKEEFSDKLDKKSVQDERSAKINDLNNIKVDKFEWRRLPRSFDGRECMIIASGGECKDPSVVPKLRDKFDNTAQTCSDLHLLRRELDVMQDKIRQSSNNHIVQVCVDYPGVEMSRDYYLDKIKQLMTGCKQPGAQIWYTGHGERGTGNWCFQDGTISFEDIFALYMDHFRGKVLTLVCDCSYSGSWVEQCAKKLDEIEIPSCGHHTREQGILIKVLCSCRDDQQATMLSYCEEGMYVENGTIWYPNGKRLAESQRTINADFCNIHCRRDEACEIPVHHNWMDRLYNDRYVYLVRGKDHGKPAWHYVLVDKKKLDHFKEQVATGTVDVAKYGKILCSGWGEDPPEEKIKQIDDQFTQFLQRK